MNSVPLVSVCPQSLLRLVGLIAPGWARELDFSPVCWAERQGDSSPRPNSIDTCESIEMEWEKAEALGAARTWGARQWPPL